jgi:hypothetical protein
MPCRKRLSRRLSSLVVVFLRGLAGGDRYCLIQFSQGASLQITTSSGVWALRQSKLGWAVCALPVPIAATITATAPAYKSHGQAEVFIGEDDFLKTVGQSERKSI